MKGALTIEYFDSAFNALFNLVKGIDTRLMSVEKNLSGLTLAVGEIQDELHSVSRVVDKDAFTTIDHERRITKLETIKA